MISAWPERAGHFEPDRFDVFDPGRCRMRQRVTAGDLRPGGTVSGPTLMQLADSASYALILGHLGDAALAVTTSLSIDFLRRPFGPELVADCELVKLGRSLIVCRVVIASAEEGAAPDPERPEAIANVTYSQSLV
ncbi:MAG: PaaI family thioesterase [Acidimicrobiales bacterium]|nr:PaaI family thioesterase [Acidimicrobiales bacterium]